MIFSSMKLGSHLLTVKRTPKTRLTHINFELYILSGVDFRVRNCVKHPDGEEKRARCYATLRAGFSDFLAQKFTPLSTTNIVKRVSLEAVAYGARRTATSKGAEGAFEKNGISDCGRRSKERRSSEPDPPTAPGPNY